MVPGPGWFQLNFSVHIIIIIQDGERNLLLKINDDGPAVIIIILTFITANHRKI